MWKETTTTSTTTTTVPETWEQATDIVLPEDELDTQGNEVENNIVIDDICIMVISDYQQHGGDGANYSFDLPDTIIVDEEELEIEIYK